MADKDYSMERLVFLGAIYRLGSGFMGRGELCLPLFIEGS
jgi:hypothetical protein